MRNYKGLMISMLALVLLSLLAVGAWAKTTTECKTVTVTKQVQVCSTIVTAEPMPCVRPWDAELTASQECPMGDSPAIAHANFMLTPDGMGLTYTIEVEGIVDATAAHIHLGLPNENGPVVVNLFTGTMPEGYMDNMWPGNHYYGSLATGTITAKDLVGPLEGKSLASLLAAFHSHCAYVNVHTKAMPDGEIRGQIQ